VAVLKENTIWKSRGFCPPKVAVLPKKSDQSPNLFRYFLFVSFSANNYPLKKSFNLSLQIQADDPKSRPPLKENSSFVFLRSSNFIVK
jgi:hypothetical protein